MQQISITNVLYEKVNNLYVSSANIVFVIHFNYETNDTDINIQYVLLI